MWISKGDPKLKILEADPHPAQGPYMVGPPKKSAKIAGSTLHVLLFLFVFR